MLHTSGMTTIQPRNKLNSIDGKPETWWYNEIHSLLIRLEIEYRMKYVVLLLLKLLCYAIRN